MGESTRDLRKARRQSAQAIPVHAGMLLVFAAVFWLASRLVAVPIWLIALVLVLIGFALAGDIINLVYRGWCLRRRGDA